MQKIKQKLQSKSPRFWNILLTTLFTLHITTFFVFMLTAMGLYSEADSKDFDTMMLLLLLFAIFAVAIGILAVINIISLIIYNRIQKPRGIKRVLALISFLVSVYFLTLYPFQLLILIVYR